jgi:endonuclease/exonuclease/phosphatase family metal-dependent hydrolase
MKNRRAPHVFVWAVFIAYQVAACCIGQEPTIRVATYNTSLYRREAGQLVRNLEAGDNRQARSVAEVIQRVRPDVLLLNELDYDPAGRAAELFRSKYLAVGQNGCEPMEYGHFFTAPVNTGRPSGRDLDKDGRLSGPDDAIGFGRHHGQYGMLFLSRFPIDRERVRTFQQILWRDMPGAMLPTDPATGESYYSDDDLAVLRLASKSFWDIPIQVPAFGGNRPIRPFTLHVLCSHPTPPVFDGPEDRNGRRNHDEVRLLADYVNGDKDDYLVDDAGSRGGLAANALFVIVGDLNADPVDGDSVPGTLDQLLKHPRINASFTPASAGGKLATEKRAPSNRPQRGDPAHDTSDFEILNLRVDYVLPSRGFAVTGGGIFWPTPDQPGSQAITATDHRLVWIDIQAE